MDEETIKLLLDETGKKHLTVMLTVLTIVGALKSQPGFNRKTFNATLVRAAKGFERKGNKEVALFLNLAGGRRLPSKKE